MNEKKFSDMQVDVLREIGTIGAGHAATALSKMTGQKIVIKVPDVNIMNLEDAPNVLKIPEENVAGIYFKLKGEILGSSLVIFPVKNACFLVDIITGKTPGSTDNVANDFEKSVLMEMGNIIAGAYLTALGSMTGLVGLQSVPYIALDTAGSIFNSMLTETGLTSDIVLMIEIEFIEASKKLKGWFYVIPDVRSSTKILDALGVKK